jgi:hypothetical protein
LTSIATEPIAVAALMPISTSSDAVIVSRSPVISQMVMYDAMISTNHHAICERPRLKACLSLSMGGPLRSMSEA